MVSKSCHKKQPSKTVFKIKMAHNKKSRKFEIAPACHQLSFRVLTSSEHNNPKQVKHKASILKLLKKQ